MREGNGLHGEEMTLAILEHEPRHGAGRREASVPLKGQGFAMDPFRVTEPVDRHAELRQCLLEHPGAAVGKADQYRPVGHAAGKLLKRRCSAVCTQAALAEVCSQGAKV